jgi:DNA helicase HerA-like ATPase
MDLFTEFQRCCHSPFSSELNLVFIYEEAHVRFSTDIHRRETQILERVALQQARQQRKHGLGAVYVDQIGLFPVQVFGNLGTFVLFRLTDENSLRRVADAIGLDEEQRAEVKTLEQRRCVVFSHVC